MPFITRITCAFIIVAGGSFAVAQDTVSYKLRGQAWVEAGRIMESSRQRHANKPESTDVDGSQLRGMGAQIVVDAALSEKLSASFGIGARQVSNSVGIFVEGGTETYTPYAHTFSTFRGYVAQANLTYTEGGDQPWLAVTIGSFSHIYNTQAHNLGAYLLRGPVYPGLLMSGFQRFDLDPAKATHVGARVHHAMGDFSHDLLLLNEHEVPPTLDWSLAYIAKYRPVTGVELGAGVNFYRLIPYSRKLMEVDHIVPILDTNGVVVTEDTTTYTHQGTKLMAMFSIDLKSWIQLPGLGSEDLKIYGEAALLGVKNYGSSYSNPSDSIVQPTHWSFFKDRSERMPVMIGANLPTWRLFDRLSVEVEWYDSPHRNDLANLGNPEGLVAPWRGDPIRPIEFPSPIPTEGVSGRDSWKWSVLLEKTVASHVRFTGQVASDHYRPLPFSTGLIYQPGGTEAALSSPREWYVMGRLGFFF